jgi:hypothetical protein
MPSPTDVAGRATVAWAASERLLCVCQVRESSGRRVEIERRFRRQMSGEGGRGGEKVAQRGGAERTSWHTHDETTAEAHR